MKPLVENSSQISRDRSMGASLQSMQELDETVASVKEVCLSIKEVPISIHRPQNDDDHISVTSTIYTIADGNSVFTHRDLITNIQDVNSKRQFHGSSRRKSGSRRSRSSASTQRTIEYVIRSAYLEHGDSDTNDDLQSCAYSTDDILKDLMLANAVLATSVLSAMPDNDSKKCDSNSKYPTSPVAELMTSMSNKSSDRWVESFQKDCEMYGKRMNRLPAILSQGQDDDDDDDEDDYDGADDVNADDEDSGDDADDEDDAEWHQGRANEMNWTGEIHELSTLSVEPTSVQKIQCTSWNEGNQGGAWGFEEEMCPNTTGSTSDSSSSCSSTTKVDESITDQVDSKISEESDGWTNFGRNLFQQKDDEVSNQSPSSVADCIFEKQTEGVVSKSPESAWRRRLRKRVVV